MTRLLFSPFLWKGLGSLLPAVLVAALLGGWQGFLAGSALCVVVAIAWRKRLMRDLRRSGRGHAGGPAPLGTRRWKTVPEEVGEALKDISAEHDRMRIILSTIRDGVITLDPAGRVTLVNRATEELLAVSGHDWLGRRLEEVCTIPLLTELAEYGLEGRESPTGEFEYRGNMLEVYVTSVDAPTRAILVIRDVTEMQRLETMRRDFVANVSHELKTPLTSIRAYVETLLDGGLDDAVVNLRFTKKIEANANRLSALIADLLTLSRIESGKAVAKRARVDLTTVLRESFQSLAPAAEEKRIQLLSRIESPGVEADGDVEAVQQVLNNLISNAIKYTEHGGRVTVSLSRTDGRARIAVEDTGTGIPREDLPRIFERFYRVDKARSREQGGTGLGLAIVKHYVQALGGEVQVQSELGVGSKFTVTLPVASPATSYSAT